MAQVIRSGQKYDVMLFTERDMTAAWILDFDTGDLTKLDKATADKRARAINGCTVTLQDIADWKAAHK